MMQINILMGIIVAWCVAIVIASGFICVPIYKLWTLDRVVNGTCINLDKFYYGIQIPNLVTDILIIVLPIREMIGLELSRKVKLGATAMFLLGIITVVFGTVRLVALVRLDGKGPDLTCKSLPCSHLAYNSPEFITDLNSTRQRSIRCHLDHRRARRCHCRRLYPVCTNTVPQSARQVKEWIKPRPQQQEPLRAREMVQRSAYLRIDEFRRKTEQMVEDTIRRRW